MVFTTMIGLKRLLALVILVSNIDPLILLVCKVLSYSICSNSLSRITTMSMQNLLDPYVGGK